MNTLAIADAIAARFAGVTATSGTVTESLVMDPTARLPNALNKGPALLVFPPEGELSVAMRRREDVLTFTVRLLRDPLNLPERTAWLYAWYDAIRDLVEAQMTLGLAYVAWAQPGRMSIEVDGYTYAGVLMDAVELDVTVRLDETVTTLGA
jgi:hypothetical protein